MASASITVTVRFRPWVEPFVQAFAACGLGKAGAAAIASYITRHGMRVEAEK